MFDLGQTLIAAAARNPDATAVVDVDVRWSYVELLERASKLVSGFDQLGLKVGDHVLIVLQNRAEFALLHWATQLAGVIATPVNWRANAEEIQFFLENSEAKAIVFEPVSADAVRDAPLAQSIQRISVGDALAVLFNSRICFLAQPPAISLALQLVIRRLCFTLPARPARARASRESTPQRERQPSRTLHKMPIKPEK